MSRFSCALLRDVGDGHGGDGHQESGTLATLTPYRRSLPRSVENVYEYLLRFRETAAAVNLNVATKTGGSGVLGCEFIDNTSGEKNIDKLLVICTAHHISSNSRRL